ncbi:MAG: hypothetical protein HON14_07720 [Rhodospirillaceae bacterium]|jgi:hypothetical protein|nr:hypothetical protein [Rhodospirillaceae bacterium]MBT7265559.1 hypothetical protein [Rhodospirillaceae bacterium]
MHLLKTVVFAGVLTATLLGVGLKPLNARDLGLTPNQVYNIWTNINKALLVFAKQQSRFATFQPQFNSLKVSKFSNKKPIDVLARVEEFSKKFHAFTGRKDFLPGEGLLTKEVVFQHRENNAVVTPSVIYLSSANLLVKFVSEIEKQIGPNDLISPFFANREFSAKEPSDVFGLVDLADRRMDLLIKGLR